MRKISRLPKHRQCQGILPGCCCVEKYTRTDGNFWCLDTYEKTDSVHFACVDCMISMDDIYAEVFAA